jgi:hypothetical protein
MDKIGMMRIRSRAIILVTIILIIIVVAVVDEVDGNDEIKPIKPGCMAKCAETYMPQIVHIRPRARALCFYLYNSKMPSPECHLF